MTWSARQHEMLEAMGFTLWRVGAAANPANPANAANVGNAANAGNTGHAASDAGVSPPVAARAANARGGDDDPLLRALRRAAGGRDPSALLPPLERLRGDAAAKRALWPRLRALRRS